MQKFIRENPTLAFGLGLPLLIVLVFMAAAVLPELGATPPRYAVVFATNYYPNNNNGLAIGVLNHKAHITAAGENNYYTKPGLYIFDPAKNSVREIVYSLPPELSPCIPKARPDCQKPVYRITPVSVPELEALTLDNSPVSPDGYVFSGFDSSYPHDFLLGGLFYSGSYQTGLVLKKGNYKVHVPQVNNIYYGANPQFIGWVIAQ